MTYTVILEVCVIRILGRIRIRNVGLQLALLTVKAVPAQYIHRQTFHFFISFNGVGFFTGN